MNMVAMQADKNSYLINAHDAFQTREDYSADHMKDCED